MSSTQWMGLVRMARGAALLALTALAGCDLLGLGQGVALSFRANDGAAFSTQAEIDTGIVVNELLLSIREVEFKVDAADASTTADVFFDGPYELDLLDSGTPTEQSIGTAEVPDGTYQAIRFKLHKTTTVDILSSLYDRSIFISGTIDGTPFEMWHDTGENLDIGEATGVVVSGGTADVVVEFDLLSFLDQGASGGATIDLSTATDGDGDGLIEINPNSDDGTVNQDLADSLKENIKLAADIIDS